MTQTENITRWFQGNRAAVMLMDKLFGVSQIADDFVDLDKEMNRSAEMTRLLTLALVEIPANEFWRINSGFLMPLLVPVLAAFNTSNVLQRNSDEDCQMMAWALRDALEHVLVGMAYLIGGQEWAAQVSIEATRYFRTNEDRESLKDWVKT